MEMIEVKDENGKIICWTNKEEYDLALSKLKEMKEDFIRAMIFSKGKDIRN